ncbi:MAG: SAM-dependent methyltransferase [Methanoregulaceae archaeon]
MRVRVLPASELVAALREPWVDPDRRPFIENSVACVPVREGFPGDSDIPERKQYRGRGYQMIGDIAVVHGTRPSGEEVAGILAWRKPRGLLWIRGYRGIERIPDCELLHGSCGDVLHREAGISYHIDPSRVMFAQGNREEKMRIARLVAESPGPERVADMFAGIGYFTLPAARAGATVHAMEINPVSFAYLSRNIAENRMEERVTAGCGDSRSLLSGEYDRIIMGHFDAAGMIPDALRHAHPGTVLHVHSLAGIRESVKEMAGDAGFGMGSVTRRVKKYSPGVYHIVEDVTLT